MKSFFSKLGMAALSLYWCVGLTGCNPGFQSSSARSQSQASKGVLKTSSSQTYLATNMTKETGAAVNVDGMSSWNVYSNGSIYKSISIATSGSYSLSVKAYGQSAAGVLPIMQILVDGKVLQKFNVADGVFKNYSASANLSAGNHKISIKFTNDYYYNGEDRNLIVYSLTVSPNSSPSPTPSPSPAPSVNSAAAIVSSSISKTSLAAGESLSETVNLSSNTVLSGLIVDIRVYVAGTENKVLAKTFEPVSLAAGTLTSLQYDTPTSGLSEGQYDIRVGVWNTAWQTLLYETREAFSIVSGAPAPAPTPTPTPDPTPAPTPAPSVSADGTAVPPANQIVDSNGGVWTLTSSATVNLNGAAAGYSANVVLLLYSGGRVYQENSAGGFWYWDGSTWMASSDPRAPAPSPSPTPAPVPSSGGNYNPNSISMDYSSFRVLSGPYALENNKWGADSVGLPLTQGGGIGPVDSSGAVSARWVWGCSSYDCQNSQQEVKGYPEIEYGQKPGYTATPGSTLPKLVNSLNSVPMSWNVTETLTGRAHLSFDIWLQSNPNATNYFNDAPLTHEIMISVDQLDYVFGAGRSLGNITVDGLTFNVSYADNFPFGSAKTWRFIVLQLVSPGTTTPLTNLNSSLDFKHVLDALKGLGMVSGSEYLSSIEFGSEMVYGTGDVFVHSFKVNAY